jgi:DNA-binding transcriptional ArsR family regulator
MADEALDPLIHVEARLRIVATLAALHDGDTLSFTRLQDMIGLTPGNLITHLRKLEDAGYLSSEKTGNGVASRTSVALTNRGRAALDAYTEALRDLLDGLQGTRVTGPCQYRDGLDVAVSPAARGHHRLPDGASCEAAVHGSPITAPAMRTRREVGQRRYGGASW